MRSTGHERWLSAAMTWQIYFQGGEATAAGHMTTVTPPLTLVRAQFFFRPITSMCVIVSLFAWLMYQLRKIWLVHLSIACLNFLQSSRREHFSLRP